MRTIKPVFWMIALATTSAWQLSVPAWAASVIEEVTVTARRVEESVQDVPLAVTALSEEDLQKRDIVEVLDLVQRVPSVQYSPATGRAEAGRFGIRGQMASDVLLTSDASIAVTISDAPMNWPYGISQMGTFDIGSVQVVKGPQNTLFGKNSTGGAVIISPNTPTQEMEGKIKLGVGNYNLRRWEAMFNAPISDQLAFRIAGAGTYRDGSLENLDDGKDFRDTENTALRASLQWDPIDTVSSLFTVEYVDTKTSGNGGRLIAVNPQTALGGLFISAFDPDQDFYAGHSDTGSVAGQPSDDFNDLEQWGVINTTTFEVSDNITLKNIISYRDFDYLGWEDLDEVNRFDLVAPIQFTSPQFTDADSITEEFQVIGSYENVDWLAGIYYSRTKGKDGSNSIQGSTTGVQGQSGPAGGVLNETNAIFAQAVWHLNDRLNLTTGVRATRDNREVTYRATNNIDDFLATCRLREVVIINGMEVEAIPEGCEQTRNESFFEPTWNVSLDYAVSDGQLLYGAVRTGYRSGGFPGRGNEPFTQQPFDAETVTDFELGYKVDASPGGQAIRVNTALFYQDYQDIQRNITLFRGNTLQNTVGNAAKGTVFGGEVELTYIPTELIELEAYAAYVDAKYDEWDELQEDGSVIDRSGNTFANIPEWSYSITGRLHIPVPDDLGELSVAANYYWQDETSLYVDNQRDSSGNECVGSQQDSFGLLNANMIWRNVFGAQGLTLNAWGRNLNDKEYYYSGLCLYNTPFGIAVGYQGDPRSYGLDISYEF